MPLFALKSNMPPTHHTPHTPHATHNPRHATPHTTHHTPHTPHTPHTTHHTPHTTHHPTSNNPPPAPRKKKKKKITHGEANTARGGARNDTRRTQRHPADAATLRSLCAAASLKGCPRQRATRGRSDDTRTRRQHATGRTPPNHPQPTTLCLLTPIRPPPAPQQHYFPPYQLLYHTYSKGYHIVFSRMKPKRFRLRGENQYFN